MRRRLFIIAAFLLAGAVVNVGWRGGARCSLFPGSSIGELLLSQQHASTSCRWASMGQLRIHRDPLKRGR